MLADDHKLFRAGIFALVQTLRGIEIVAEAADGREALRLVAAHRPDVVLMDVMMPNLNGLDAAARIARAFPRTRSEEHTSELQSRVDLVCRLLLEKKKK